jgi:hypothetical protein
MEVEGGRPCSSYSRPGTTRTTQSHTQTDVAKQTSGTITKEYLSMRLVCQISCSEASSQATTISSLRSRKFAIFYEGRDIRHDHNTGEIKKELQPRLRKRVDLARMCRKNGSATKGNSDRCKVAYLYTARLGMVSPKLGEVGLLSETGFNHAALFSKQR